MTAHRQRTAIAAALVTAVGFASAGTARADSAPVGPLPAPRVTVVSTAKGALVTVTARMRAPASGLVWRVARRYDATIVRQVGEAEVGGAVVLVFEVVGRGRTAIVLALTRGESSSKALQAIRYDIRAS